eukprot:TRINITY_DN111133_c0_g1_i1.p1 TRINITY_DN111133_c0_g1~~TRINITY_DN111133_c0_g1_i1.p1  ORF type:complete len:275 (-),score=56.05 TRINITY_DN111133_c0_g1_i1:142-966(-)
MSCAPPMDAARQRLATYAGSGMLASSLPATSTIDAVQGVDGLAFQARARCESWPGHKVFLEPPEAPKRKPSNSDWEVPDLLLPGRPSKRKTLGSASSDSTKAGDVEDGAEQCGLDDELCELGDAHEDGFIFQFSGSDLGAGFAEEEEEATGAGYLLLDGLGDDAATPSPPNKSIERPEGDISGGGYNSVRFAAGLGEDREAPALARSADAVDARMSAAAAKMCSDKARPRSLTFASYREPPKQGASVTLLSALEEVAAEVRSGLGERRGRFQTM